MKFNVTPFIDIFSILSIGFLVLMSITSETPDREGEAHEGRTHLMVQVSLQWSDSDLPDIPLERLIHLEPYFIRNDAILEKWDFDGYHLENTSDGTEIYIWGNVNKASVAIRVKKVVDRRVYGKTGKIVIQSVSSQGDRTTYDFRIGNWNDPVLALEFSDQPHRSNSD